MKKLKLNALHKEVLQKKEMNSLTGGTYCYDFNKPDAPVQRANEGQGKCSCICQNIDYYGSDGLNKWASTLLKAPSAK